MKKYKAILFDLDGTLLPMDMDEFMNGYFKELTGEINYDVSPEIFKRYIWQSTMDMITSIEKEKTNQDVFFESFSKLINDDIVNYKNQFNSFYKEHFPNLKQYTKPDPIVKDIIEFLKEKNVKMVVATNPVFPREAIEHRIDWAGLNTENFDLITSYENMHFTKPNSEYYKEILDKIGIDKENAIMVGNDMDEDIVASKIGLQTFYIDTYGIDKGVADFKPDHVGSLRDFFDYIKEIYK
ncbi:HAD family hydrolase [Clostridium sp. D2Q-11]|uniref:HAD family hydrolase n=1 Tax=Anaeromonas frigoriresistens TaxID=2683708 RepID=A0A942Z765_9FIRM|nr:HAD family hydrolase [Anaeromonas frigoriresistens]MBS4536918.1 HAD family hydrolase [Anaeromonas frigoriresistens]